MSEEQLITSLQNPRIKNILKLATGARERRLENRFLIEGAREIEMAMRSGFEFESCFYLPGILKKESREILNSLAGNTRKFEVDPKVYSKIAYRENTDGIVIIAKPRNKGLHEIKLGEKPLILVLETVEKPGNLGALLRTADAANLDAVIICDPMTDIYNPNVIRSSLGCIFTNQVVVSTSKDAISFLKTKGIKIYAAALQNSVIYYHADFRDPSAIVMGSEAKGLTADWRTESDKIIKIPMGGKADSLNVSVSAAILIFEAVRQRNSLT
jgi:TrmH family RNA methyltransferase